MWLTDRVRWNRWIKRDLEATQTWGERLKGVKLECVNFGDPLLFNFQLKLINGAGTMASLALEVFASLVSFPPKTDAGLVRSTLSSPGGCWWCARCQQCWIQSMFSDLLPMLCLCSRNRYLSFLVEPHLWASPGNCCSFLCFVFLFWIVFFVQCVLLFQSVWRVFSILLRWPYSRCFNGVDADSDFTPMSHFYFFLFFVKEMSKYPPWWIWRRLYLKGWNRWMSIGNTLT